MQYGTDYQIQRQETREDSKGQPALTMAHSLPLLAYERKSAGMLLSGPGNDDASSQALPTVSTLGTYDRRLLHILRQRGCRVASINRFKNLDMS